MSLDIRHWVFPVPKHAMFISISTTCSTELTSTENRSHRGQLLSTVPVSRWDSGTPSLWMSCSGWSQGTTSTPKSHYRKHFIYTLRAARKNTYLFCHVIESKGESPSTVGSKWMNINIHHSPFIGPMKINRKFWKITPLGKIVKKIGENDPFNHNKWH